MATGRRDEADLGCLFFAMPFVVLLGGLSVAASALVAGFCWTLIKAAWRFTQ